MTVQRPTFSPLATERVPARRGRRRGVGLVFLCALLAGAVLTGVVLAGLLWRGDYTAGPLDVQDAVALPSAPAPEVLARGAYLVRIGACMGCHTQQGGTVLAGGGEVRTPFGVFRAPNLTPDDATGLGRWSLQDFRRAMRHGIARDGRLLYPAFPYEQYTHLRTGDVDALYHYLHSLQPVVQAAPPHTLQFPYGSQWALALWRGLFFTPAEVDAEGVHDTAAAAQAQVSAPDAQAPGAYLVQAVAHCAACHSPRNGWGALGGGQRLEGGLMPSAGWQAPSLLDSREAGVQRWSQAAIVQLLRSGHTEDGAVASGPMADAVFWSTQYLTPLDAQAIARYLHSLPDAAPPTRIAAEKTPKTVAIQANLVGAKALYRTHCADCHGAAGQGQQGAFPPLAGNRAVLRADPGNLLRSILQGGYAPTTVEHPAPHGMPPFMQTLGDAEIAALATYIRQSWGNRAPAVATMEVFRARQGRP